MGIFEALAVTHRNTGTMLWPLAYPTLTAVSLEDGWEERGRTSTYWVKARRAGPLHHFPLKRCFRTRRSSFLKTSISATLK